ncbi:hypothetical protein [Actinacidiphila sp. ITFR-21]|uniref:hypothetical protein n=1 Tax=Actinacidiphila sp. ITFR-21 TaxID=3075199 RepID=UPI00288B86BA|nr:hypothetical protein [Streptomyces sp. ITFR-21]WNI16910.1 hypothetical protein RLT57_16200 [Streptomyces sp. ITFR-21]
MTAPQVLPHVDAVQAALAAGGLTVYLGGAPPRPADRYAVLYPEPGQAVRESLADARTHWSGVVTITSVATTAEQALWVADKIRAALAGPLVVQGRVAWRPEELGGPPLARDDDVTPPLFYAPVQYRLQSIPS